MLMHQGSQAPRIQPSQAHTGPQTSGSGPQRPIGLRALFWPRRPSAFVGLTVRSILLDDRPSGQWHIAGMLPVRAFRIACAMIQAAAWVAR